MKRILASALVTTIIAANSIGVYAQGFTDVKSNYWAKDYINKLVDAKVITGYPDGTFKPQDNVSKLATITMIYKSVKGADKLGDFNEDAAVKKYFYTLQQYNIPEWPKPSVAYAIDSEIIQLNDLMGLFNSDGSQKYATRSEVAVYVGKLLCTLLGENVEGSFVALSFKDSTYISSKDAPYVDLLSKKKILSGDENGNFNPNQPIQRSAIAKIFAVTYDIIKEQKAVSEVTTEITGTLMYILDNKNILVQDKDNNKYLYVLDDSVQVIINDKISKKDALVEKQQVKVVAREDGTVKSITVDQNMVELEGTFKSIVDMGDYILVVVEDKDDNKKTFKAISTTDIYLNDKKVNIQAIENNDRVVLKLDGDTITKLSAKSRNQEFKGILDKDIYFESAPMLTIRTNTQNVYSFAIDDDVYVKRNNKKVGVTSLVKGDIIEITVEDDEVEKIIATTVKQETEGVIAEIVMGDQNKLTIKAEDGEKYEYVVSEDVDVEIDDKNSKFADLKTGYEVELRIESETIVDIEAKKIDTTDKLDGTIIDVYDDFEAIKIRTKKNGENVEYTVLVDDANITTTRGSTRRFSALDKGDVVFVYGEKGTDIFDFKATTVIIVEDN